MRGEVADLRQLRVGRPGPVGGCRGGGDGRAAVGLCGLAGLQGDHVLSAGARLERGAKARKHVGLLLMAVQEQDSDQGLRPVNLAELLLGQGPERLVLGGEGALGAGLVQRLGTVQRPGLAQQPAAGLRP